MGWGCAEEEAAGWGRFVREALFRNCSSSEREARFVCEVFNPPPLLWELCEGLRLPWQAPPGGATKPNLLPSHHASLRTPARPLPQATQGGAVELDGAATVYSVNTTYTDNSALIFGGWYYCCTAMYCYCTAMY